MSAVGGHMGLSTTDWWRYSSLPSTYNTNDKSGGTNGSLHHRTGEVVFDATIGDQLASKLPTRKSIEILAVGSRTDWNIADQYAQYLKTKGFAVSFTRTSETVPPLDHKITIRDDPTTSPIIVIIAPSPMAPTTDAEA